MTELGICKVKTEQNNKQKMCKFYVAPGNGLQHWHWQAEHYTYKM